MPSSEGRTHERARGLDFAMIARVTSDARCTPQIEGARARVGRTLLGKWTLEEVRGVGGMATVYAARHRQGARVAIKMLHPQLSASMELRLRFAREAYLSNLVDHPGAVRVLDDDVDPLDGCAFLVMDLVEGTPLDDPRFRPFDDAKLLDVAEQVLEVLVAAHRNGVVHRDLKPENLLVQSDGRVRVLDFGIARALDERFDPKLTREGTTCGTPEFVSPEQAMGKRALVSGKTDVYALGATLFFLASGEAIHGEGTPFDLVVRAAREPARSLATVRKDLHPRVVALVDRATRLEIGDRPSAVQLLAAVRSTRHALRLPRRALTTERERSTTAPPTPVVAMKRLSTWRAIAAIAGRRTMRIAAVAAVVIALATALQLARARKTNAATSQTKAPTEAMTRSKGTAAPAPIATKDARVERARPAR